MVRRFHDEPHKGIIGAFDVYEDAYDHQYGRPADGGRTVGWFQRNTTGPRLVLVPAAQRVNPNYRSSENWEQASDPFIYESRDGSAYDHESASTTVAAAWAANSGAAIATLKSAVNTALNNAGFRSPQGEALST